MYATTHVHTNQQMLIYHFLQGKEVQGKLNMLKEMLGDLQNTTNGMVKGLGAAALFNRVPQGGRELNAMKKNKKQKIDTDDHFFF